MPNDKWWDVFISHAGEDKMSVAIPLADALRRAGVKVWLDKRELRIGDSLRQKIDEGLVESRFGVLVLSPSFLRKNWPTRELNGLTAIEETGVKVILPVWHNLDKATLLKYSPILADRLAMNTQDGIAAIAEAIVAEVFRADAVGDSESPSRLLRRFQDILVATDDPDIIRDFLSSHLAVVAAAFRTDTETLWKWSVDLECNRFDIGIGRLQPTTGRRDWQFVILGSPRDLLVLETGEITAFVRDAVKKINQGREWVAGNLAAARQGLPDLSSHFAAFVIGGRRDHIAQGAADVLSSICDLQPAMSIRTYDMFVDVMA